MTTIPTADEMIYLAGCPFDACINEPGYDASCGMRPIDEWRAIFWAIICPRQVSAMYIRECDRTPAPALPQALQSAAEVQPGKNETETEAKIEAALKRKGATNVDELIRDINHALEPVRWAERVNQYGVVTLVDDCWLRRGKSGDIHLEAGDLIEGVVVSTVGPDGKSFVTINRGQIIDWLAKRKREAARTQRVPPPFPSKTSDQTGLLLTGVA